MVLVHIGLAGQKLRRAGDMLLGLFRQTLLQQENAEEAARLGMIGRSRHRRAIEPFGLGHVADALHIIGVVQQLFGAHGATSKLSGIAPFAAMVRSAASKWRV